MFFWKSPAFSRWVWRGNREPGVRHCQVLSDFSVLPELALVALRVLGRSPQLITLLGAWQLLKRSRLKDFTSVACYSITQSLKRPDTGLLIWQERLFWPPRQHKVHLTTFPQSLCLGLISDMLPFTMIRYGASEPDLYLLLSGLWFYF